ncbi:MAG: translocation/assembly module TamB, partial [Bacteroidota bacterium]|nr:translocation/assembly module TamB [Bacteroidota bacterium]MDX5431392.1 translocation/assembly module TamB [Bacteroidota bacterium]MDX5470122.1 translocation/assembly module TamB [Bacteroidota bacterium]
NLINKKFIIEKGGKITWNGDPMKGNLNLEATYNTKASMENLVSGIVESADLPAYRQRTDVDAIMKLRGELTAPEIRFGFRLPNISSLSSSGINTTTLQTVMRKIEQDQEEMTRQVFSLLVANTFIRPAVNQQVATTGDMQGGLLSSSVGDLLSNQVSNWLGQINSNWNLGVNYVMGIDQSDLLFNASRKFLNDRLEVEGTFGTNSNVYNNINFMYSVTPDGRLKVRAFNRTGTLQNTDPNTTNTGNTINRNINTQGVGLSYSIEFDVLNEERKQIRDALREDKKAPPIP